MVRTTNDANNTNVNYEINHKRACAEDKRDII